MYAAVALSGPPAPQELSFWAEFPHPAPRSHSVDVPRAVDGGTMPKKLVLLVRPGPGRCCGQILRPDVRGEAVAHGVPTALGPEVAAHRGHAGRSVGPVFRVQCGR